MTCSDGTSVLGSNQANNKKHALTCLKNYRHTLDELHVGYFVDVRECRPLGAREERVQHDQASDSSRLFTYLALVPFN